MTEHISKQYDQDLEAIRSRMMQMGGLVEAQIRTAVDGYLDGNLERIEQVIAADSKVNELEVAIDDDLRHVIVRRQPAASDRASGRVIGDCGLQMLEGGPQVEIGYKLARAVRGRGLAAEAGRACLAAGFDELGLERIVAVADPDNVASRRVMKKLGMTLMGRGRHYGSETVLYEIRRTAPAPPAG